MAEVSTTLAGPHGDFPDSKRQTASQAIPRSAPYSAVGGTVSGSVSLPEMVPGWRTSSSRRSSRGTQSACSLIALVAMKLRRVTVCRSQNRARSHPRVDDEAPGFVSSDIRRPAALGPLRKRRRPQHFQVAFRPSVGFPQPLHAARSAEPSGRRCPLFGIRLDPVRP
jgi:hypothetical protein